MLTQTEQHTYYDDLFRIKEPIDVWTPDGSYKAPDIIGLGIANGKSLPQAILEAKQMEPGQIILTSGEWYRIRERVQQIDAAFEYTMIDGCERTSTILDFVHGKAKKYFDGFLIQIPEVDNDGNLLEDENGILKARHIWEMALPLSSDHVKNMPPEFDPFLNTIYGMENARERLPDSAYVCMGNPRGVLRNLLRGKWGPSSQRDARIDVDCEFGPLDLQGTARNAVEGSIIYQLNAADYEAAMNLLKKEDKISAKNESMRLLYGARMIKV